MPRLTLIFIPLALLLLMCSRSEHKEENNTAVDYKLTPPYRDSLCRMAHDVPWKKISECLSSKNRNRSLKCIQACACLENPWPALPLLADLMRSRDRDIASQSAHSLLTGLQRINENAQLSVEVPRTTIRELRNKLEKIRDEKKLPVDITTAAQNALTLLENTFGTTSSSAAVPGGG